MRSAISRAVISIRRSPLGLWAAGRCANKHVVPYIIAQVIGAILAAAALWIIASGKPDWVPGGFASNGYGDLSPGKYGLAACFLTEILATFFFLFIIIGTTSKGAADRFRRHPDRPRADPDPSHHDPGHEHVGEPGAQHRAGSFAGGAYIGQLWLFWVAPIVGAVIAGLLTRWMYEQEAIVETTVVEERRLA